MAITTLATALSGLKEAVPIAKTLGASATVGIPQTWWGRAGYGGTGTYDTTLNGVTLSSTSALVAGQIDHFDPASGNAYLARARVRSSHLGCVWIMDRLWHNGGYDATSTSAQNSTTPTWPARDNNGSTNGAGVFLALEISATMGAAAPNITIDYTNSAGTSGRTGTNVRATLSGATLGHWFQIGLQAGDIGVRSVQSLTLSASWISGTMNLVAYRMLACLPIVYNNQPAWMDALTGGFVRLYDGTVPFLALLPGTTSNPVCAGHYMEAQG